MADLDRRRFLTLLGIGGAAGLSACTASGSSTKPSETVTATRTKVVQQSPTATVSPASRIAATTLDQLATQVDGQVIAKGTSKYRQAHRAYDPPFDRQHPAAVVRAQSSDDVARVVEYAARTNTRIAARGGGHSYAGYSTPNKGIVVDLSPMAGIEIDGESARVGAGARLIDVYTALAKSGRSLPSGSCPTVGIAGITLGGGVGVLTRSFGLTCDRLTAADVITADGALHHASADNDSDLFWALRGGGGGNVGIVTSFTFSTAPQPHRLVKFGLQFPDGAAGDVLDAWQTFTADAPEHLNMSMTITANDDPYAFVYGTYLGSHSAANTLLDSFVLKVGASTTYRSVQTMSVEDAMYSYAQCSGKSLAECGPDWTGHGSGTVPRTTFVGTSRILRQAADPGAFVDAVKGSNTSVLIDSITGAAGRLSPTATAFPHRGALATVQIYQSGSDPSAIDSVRASLGNLLGPYGYVNYIDATMPNWAEAYYAGNLPRLRSIAQRYDPDRVFRFAQSVNT